MHQTNLISSVYFQETGKSIFFIKSNTQECLNDAFLLHIFVGFIVGKKTNMKQALYFGNITR